jgi:hypothetical protein
LLKSLADVQAKKAQLEKLGIGEEPVVSVPARDVFVPPPALLKKK